MYLKNAHSDWLIKLPPYQLDQRGRGYHKEREAKSFDALLVQTAPGARATYRCLFKLNEIEQQRFEGFLALRFDGDHSLKQRTIFALWWTDCVKACDGCSRLSTFRLFIHLVLFISWRVNAQNSQTAARRRDSIDSITLLDCPRLFTNCILSVQQTQMIPKACIHSLWGGELRHDRTVICRLIVSHTFSTLWSYTLHHRL